MKLTTFFITATAYLSFSASAAPIAQPQETYAATSSLKPGKSFDRIFTIVLENEDYSNVIKDSYLKSLTANHNARLLTNYKGVSHPSQGNYIAMITGGVDILFDGNVDVDKKNVVDLLEQAGVSWKAYQENYPGNCFAGDSKDKLYRRKHNPFISMNDIRNDPSRCSKIVPATELATDIQSNSAPQYIFYTPNMDNDGHDTSLSYSTTWLKSFLEPILSNSAFMQNTLVVVTWDESESYLKPNQVATYLIGPNVDLAAVGKEDGRKYDHYSLLRTVEDNWGLGNLGRGDTKSQAFSGLKRQ